MKTVGLALTPVACNEVAGLTVIGVVFCGTVETLEDLKHKALNGLACKRQTLKANDLVRRQTFLKAHAIAIQYHKPYVFLS